MRLIRASKSGAVMAWALGLCLLAGCSAVSARPSEASSVTSSTSAGAAPISSQPAQSLPPQSSADAPFTTDVSTAAAVTTGTTSDSIPSIAVPATQTATPRSLTAESIGLAQPLIELGLLADGTAETPADYDDAGWFSGGGRPGGIGPTVLLGHVDSLDGPAVFYRLRELAIGDVVTVELSDGTAASYSVTDNRTYEKADFPTFTVFGATPKDVLHLVTCGGAFDDDALSYESNIVITAERTS